ncbi:MAG: deoxyribose-phosphate aldolase [Hyphomicrobiales bacterium]
MNDSELFKKLIGCLDLSAIDADDTVTVDAMCSKAHTPHGNVAAVCVKPRFVAQAKKQLADSSVKVAAVINFPQCSEDTLALEQETAKAIANGADEIDFLMAHKALSEGRPGFAETQIVRIKRVCGQKPLKVILEVGSLDSDDIIREATDVALAAGADILVSASDTADANLNTAQLENMLSVVAKQNKALGIKFGGHLTSIVQAQCRYESAKGVYGEKALDANHFRLGGNDVLDEMLAKI